MTDSDRWRTFLRCLGAVTVIAGLAAPAALAATRYDPRLRFRTITTPRFDIHFHQGEESIARRLAQIAEQVASSLDDTLGPAFGRVQVVIVDQSDISNGWATPLPYNLIEIAAAGPGGATLIGNTDDWLRLVFTHEYTHIVHLGRSGGWIGGLRRVFGRNPALFPNATLPLWAIEGIATFEESDETGAGRVNGGDFRQILTTAAAAGRFEPIDRASGGLDDWPAGNAQYAYGGYFHRFLAESYGEDSLRRLTDETGRRLPYLGSRAFQRIYGRSLGALWSDFEASVRSGASAPALDATRVTTHGFTVRGPRFAPSGEIYYSVVNPHGFPALMKLDSSVSAPRAVTTRYLGQGLGIAGAELVFDQSEIVANVGLQSDLYAWSSSDRRTTRITHGSRASDPDLAPDRRTVVFTTQHADRRDLLTAPINTVPQTTLGANTVLISEPGTELTSPRWSPDGRTVAAERRVRGSLPQVVIIDVADRSVRTVVAFPGSRSVTPAWMPDGNSVIFASTRDGGPFRLFRIELRSGEILRLEGTGVSAHSPDISADGRTLVFVGYTPDGSDLFTLPLATARWQSVPSLPDVEATTPLIDQEAASAAAAERRYAPWNTLAPRFWTPVLESDSGETTIGAATGGADPLGRHGYVAGVRWALAGKQGDNARRPSARPDMWAAYAYDRWWPTLFLTASDDTDPYRSGEARSQEITAGFQLPWRRVRWSRTLFSAIHAATNTVRCASCATPIDARAARRSIQSGWLFTSAKSYGYSISREEGWSLRATGELIRRALGADGDATAVTADLRAYRRAGARHAVLAARIAGAVSRGAESVRRDFTAAGDGSANASFSVESDAIGLLRGFDDELRGRHAAVLNVDYRVPLWRIERGRGTWPAFARVLHGALFVDAGHAWNGPFRRAELRVSAGAELSLDTVLGYALPVTFTGGAAWRVDPHAATRGAAIFARVGRAF